jgi:hypothetical protein
VSVKLQINFAKLLLVGIGAILCISPVDLSLWQVQSTDLKPAIWNNALPVIPLAAITDASLEIAHETALIQSVKGSWSSPITWQVLQAEWGDLNHDGNPEAILLVRRPFAPWPIDRLLPHGGRINTHQDSEGMSSHLILMGWKKDHWAEIWAGSALARPVLHFEVFDIDKDGHSELMTLEGVYNTGIQLQGTSLAVWDWNGFGFDMKTRIEEPMNRFFILETEQNQTFLLTD